LAQQPHWRIREWFKGRHEIDERAFERLRIYHIELVRWTQKINLISPGTVADADRIHFADGILGCLIISKDLGNQKRVVDLGSGNGIPGVVFSILRPELGVTCIDSDERKISFIKQLSLRLDLENLAARAVRVEKLEPDSIDCAMARGFASVEKSLLYINQAMKAGGTFYHFKGQEWPTEVGEISAAVCSTWNTRMLEDYQLPPVSEAKVAKPETRVIIKSEKKT
jgi:16S rRNA (guanine527-N7)-methyltransferase